jgi:Asp-tRNA(Asn)/Glu-tRNA(Gln) amidotransferase A subunit family amidase
VNRDALCYESTVSLARRIRAGEVSPLQAVNAYLERIERVDPFTPTSTWPRPCPSGGTSGRAGNRIGS